MVNIDNVELIPKKVLFGNPVKTSPQISPNGKIMSYLAPVDNVLNVWIGDINTSEAHPITKDTDRGVLNYFWAQDNQHILYLQDKDGNENWRLYAIDLETNNVRDFTPFENVQVQVIAHDKHFPNELLIGMNKDNPNVHDVYNLNLKTGELKKVAENPGNIAGWQIDSNLKIRGAMCATEEGGFDLLIRDNEESEWKKLVSWAMEDSLNSGAVSFSKDGKYLYLLDSRNNNTGRLTKIEIATAKNEVIIEDPEYDVSNVMTHPDTYEIQMVSFNKARNENIIFDESIRDDLERIAKLSNGDFVIYDRDDADKTWLLGFTEDDGPVSFYAYDRQKKEGKLLFYNKPDLKKYQLAKMKPISFISRDGLTIHGYLTMPIGYENSPVPMILNVHGGPWHRDSWGYNPEAQWMANRGYACLQVNFRGSTGYGKNFLNAGDKEWGAKMHDDLLDAVNWAVKNNYTEADKVAIYGGSYGGYAALVGATFTPDVFRCAIDIVGPSSLITLINTIPAYWSTFLANFKNRVGDPATEEEFLKSRSPLFKVDQIKIPMLIAQGANDPRVKQSEAEQIVEAMKSKNIDYEYLLFPDEGHGFVKPENKIKFYDAAEKFLAKQLNGRSE
ncbi:MAG: S9 family peptidase [Candidatus Sericytochromatia bacterium]|nr:S9 family peptidase [Candidatus Sericytochromatia bacterium]